MQLIILGAMQAVGIHPDKALTYSDDDIDRIKELARCTKGSSNR